MKKIITSLSLLAFMLPTGMTYAQSEPSLDSTAHFGGTDNDRFESAVETDDGGVVLAGHSYSLDHDITSPKGSSGIDAVLVKYDNSGNKVWNKNFGGGGADSFYAVDKANDGGYIAAGSSQSGSGDLPGNKGGTDAIITKFDSGGNKIWVKNIGGSNMDNFYSVTSLSDGGYAAAGTTRSANGDLGENKGDYDALIARFDGNGNILWIKNIGGSRVDKFESVISLGDGSLIAVGYSDSIDGDISSRKGGYDAVIAKFDASGNLVWHKNIGGTVGDYFHDAVLTENGGFAAAGNTSSGNGDMSGNIAGSSATLAQFDSNGNLISINYYGGSSTDGATSVAKTKDGGYILSGYSYSTNGMIGSNKGSEDAFILKTDPSGTFLWSKVSGGSGYDRYSDVSETSDGKYIGVGYSDSADGDFFNNIQYEDAIMAVYRILNEFYSGAEVSVQSGNFLLTAPSAGVNFGSVSIDGTLKTLNASLASLIIQDFRGTAEGYHLTAEATPMRGINDPANVLQAGSLILNAPQAITRVSGSSSLPTLSLASQASLDSGAVKVLSAASGSGTGEYELAFPTDSLRLSVDTASIKSDTYESTVTWTLVSGP